MEIQLIEKTENKELWNQFLLAHSASFLQSFEWGELERAAGKKVWRIQVKKNQQILTQAQIIKESFPLGIKHCFYLPFGPVIKKNISEPEKTEAARILFDKIRALSKTENAMFLLVEPQQSINFPSDFLIKPAVKRIQPQKTLLLELNQAEEEIFKNFHSGAKYNIRLAERKGVRVQVEEKYSPEFYRLIKKTAQRKELVVFGEEHYKKLFQFQSKDFQAKMFLGQYENKTISAYIMLVFGQIAICLHGASDRDYRKVKPSDILQWHRIKEARANGCRYCDFWGIDEQKWPGITKFKKGFGGKEYSYPQGSEIVFQPLWNRTYKLIKRIL